MTQRVVLARGKMARHIQGPMTDDRCSGPSPFNGPYKILPTALDRVRAVAPG